MIRLQEDRIWASVSRLNLTGEPRRLHASLKSLREAIQYSIQHVGTVGQRQEYRTLAGEVAALCVQVQNVPQEHPDVTTAGRLADAADQLRRQVEQLAAGITRQPG